MPRKKGTHKNNSSFNTLVGTVSLFLLFDGILRIAFAIPLFAFFYGGMFHVRWFFLGMFEALLALGIFKQKKWALYLLIMLSLARVYTLLSFPPSGILPPIERNLTFYLIKIVPTAAAFYFFTKRKYFT